LSTLLQDLTVTFVGESHYRSVQIARKVPKIIDLKKKSVNHKHKVETGLCIYTETEKTRGLLHNGRNILVMFSELQLLLHFSEGTLR